MSADDVWGVGTWHMNQTLLDVEPGSATKDKKSIMTKKKKEREKKAKSQYGTKQPLTMCQISEECSNTRQ